VTSNASIISTQVVDNFSLAQLQALSFDNSSKCDGLLDSKFWDTAIQTSGNTTAHLVPNTVYGLTQSWNGWTDFFRNNMTNPPAWLSLGLGNYTSSLEAGLAAKIMRTNNITLAAAVMKNYTTSIGAIGAVGLDTLSWGGLSAVKVYYQTGSWKEATAQTFPAQVYQLFTLSQDCSYPEQQRAQFLGTALSMTALIAATSGKDGFGPQFQGLLTKLGLRDAWQGVKGYLKTINDASPAAAYETTMVLAALGKKFPANFNSLASLTASRISIMVQVLKEKGLTPDQIDQKVAQLNQAVGESDDPNHVAEVADKISYGTEGLLRVTVDSDLAVDLFYQQGRRSITASFLASVLPGFKVGETTALKVTVHKLWMKLPSYHVYEGGSRLGFTLPEEQVKPRDQVGVSFELLPLEDFVKSIPDFGLANSGHLPWIADAAVLKDFKVADGTLEFRMLQNNEWSNKAEYDIQGVVTKYPGISPSAGIYADFAIKDYTGRTTNLRLLYDGFRLPALEILKGSSFDAIKIISWAGFRLSIVYRTDTVTTVYMEPPTGAIYNVGAMRPYSGQYLSVVQGKYANAWQISDVTLLRDLEKGMLARGGTYDLGRLGAENAYVVADKNLGLKNIVLEEPSKGGRDLYTQDNTVAIQARLLRDLTQDNRQKLIAQALYDLSDKLQEDYRNQPQMRDGYAILSYLDADGTLKTIVLEVPKW